MVGQEHRTAQVPGDIDILFEGQNNLNVKSNLLTRFLKELVSVTMVSRSLKHLDREMLGY